MKKILAITAALMLSTVAFAGPLIGLQVTPAVDAQAGLVIGWDFGYASIEGSKTNFNTWYGEWSLAGLWTPDNNGFSYRIGPKITWDWNRHTGSLTYKDLSIVVGVAKTWGAFQVFGEFDVGSTGTLSLRPIIGLNILFDGFFPKDDTE